MRLHAAALTREQRQRILAQLQPAGAYLVRLTRRMQRRGWHPQDPAYIAAVKAHESLVSLSMALHYAGTGQAWQPPDEELTAPPMTRRRGRC